MAEGYLPPVVIDFVGSMRDVTTTVGKVKTLLGDLEKSDTTVDIDADAAKLEAALATARTQLYNFSRETANSRLGADTASFWGDIARLKTLLSADSADLDLDLDIKPALAKIAILRGEEHLAAMDTLSMRYVPSFGTTAAAAAINKALMKAFPASYPVEVKPDISITSLAEARAQLLALTRGAQGIRLTANAKTLWAQIAGINAAIAHQEANMKLGLDPQWGEIAASMAAVKATVGATKLDMLIGLGVAGAAGGAAAGGAGLSSTLMTLLGLSAAGRGAFTRLPKGGTLLSFGGLGLEHFIMTLIGVIGTTAGAMLGGAVLAMGSMGVAAVGMGSNMLVGGSTMADVDSMYKLLAANSKETYAAAMKSIGLPQDAGTRSEWTMAQALVSLNSYWDTATSAARVAAVGLYTQFLGVAKTYIPQIAAAAKSNFSAMSKDLQPLFSWLKSPTGGIGIFDQLEKIHLGRLPEEMSTLTNALEGFAKTIAYVAPKGGGFLNSLNKFFGDLNAQVGKPGTADTRTLDNWITDWHVLTQFIKTFYDTVRDLFRADTAHTGRAVLQDLTSMMLSLDKFEQSMTGKQKLGQLFEVHKKEILAILDLIPPIAKSLSSIYGTIAPGLVTAVTTVIRGAVDALSTLAKLKISGANVGAWAVGLGLIALRLTGLGKGIGHLAVSLGSKALATGLSALSSLLGNTKIGNWLSGLASKLSGTGAASFPAAVTEFAAAVTRFAASAGIGGAEAAGGGAVAGEEAVLGASFATKIAGAFGKVFAGATALAIGYTIGDAINRKLNLSGKIAKALTTPPPTQAQSDLAYFTKLAGILHQTPGIQTLERADLKNLVPLITGANFSQLTAGMMPSEVAGLRSIMTQLGMHISDGLITGITKNIPKVEAGMGNFARAVSAAMKANLLIRSPSGVFAEIGKNLDLGLIQGMVAGLPGVRSASRQLASAALVPTKGYGGSYGLAGGGGIHIQTTITVQAPTGNAADISRTLSKALDQRDNQLIAKLRSGTSGRMI
jgi:hypothetical protein